MVITVEVCGQIRKMRLKACTYGYNVLFKNAATLSTELCEAKDNYHLGKLERTLARADLLILDELSYLGFNRHQSELLFKVISDISEKKQYHCDDKSAILKMDGAV